MSVDAPFTILRDYHEERNTHKTNRVRRAEHRKIRVIA